MNLLRSVARFRDIQFLLRQLSIIDHMQDREGIRALAARYGFEFPLFDEDVMPKAPQPPKRDWKAAQELFREIVASKPNTGPHGSHCWMNEYPTGCKYGDDDCPARPDMWPYRTFDENGVIVLVTEDLEILYPES